MTEPPWTASWVWGLPLIAITLGIHALGVVASAILLARLGHLFEAGPLSRNVPFLAAVISAVGCAMALLHGLEAAIWAAAYLWLGALNSFADAMLYSLDSITTRGESGLVLQRHWRLMGALEAANGVLLFGLSTAFLFVVLERTWQILNKALIHRHP